MSFKKATIIVLILGLSQFTNGSFFGLFSSSKPTRKPDVIVSESPKSETDTNAYQNYLRSLASTYYSSAIPPSPAPVQYVPSYTYQQQPQLYPNYIQPQRNFIYEPRILKTATVPLQYNYQPMKTSVNLSSVKLARPITVLPSSSYEESSISASGGSNNFNKLIEESPSPASQSEVPTKIETYEFEIPEPQVSATLYDLPVSGISPDYQTGGYVTKMMKISSTDSDNTSRSGRKFGHAYDNRDGTKVSEEGQLVQHGNGKETVLKRGQYEYIDANGKLVLVKWIADDNGYRLVN